MTQVIRNEGESFESLLRRFRIGVTKGGVIQAWKRHEAFMSKRERRRLKAEKTRRKLLRKQAQQKDHDTKLGR